MNEGAKTGIYVGLAAVAALVAVFLAVPRGSTEFDVEEIIGEPLFASFQDALEVRSMRVVEFDEELGELSNFEVARDPQTGVWRIPTHGGYPADATDQMRNAATAMLDLHVLDIASELKEDHAKFGVIEPDKNQLEVGDQGVGTLVVMENNKGDDVVDLIIGKAARDNENQRFVRKPTQDVVYVVELDGSPFTTDFEDWIEEDLLQLSTFDIRGVSIKDYSIVRTLTGGAQLHPKFEADLAVDDGNNWEPKRLVEFDQRGQPTPITLGENQELNAEKLTNLKNALDDLAIVDVYRKPEGLSADLKADADIMQDQEALNSLYSKGFYPQQVSEDQAEVLAANGELIVTLQDGVQYLLRFGDIESVDQANETEGDDSTGLNRYLMVSARVDEGMFPPPELEPVPETLEELDLANQAAAAAANPPLMGPAAEGVSADPQPADAEEAAATDAEAAANDSASEGQAEPAEEGAPAEESSEEPTDEPASEEAAEVVEEVEPADDAAESGSGETEGEGSGSVSGEGLLQQEEGDGEESGEPAGDEAPPAGDAAQADAGEAEDSAEEKDAPAAENTDADSADTDSADAGAAEATEADDTTTASAPVVEETEEEKRERLEAEQERIRKANQRKIDERNEKLEEAREKVRELNARFADWYYVVPEKTYSDLRLSKDELITSATEASAEPAGVPGGLGGLGGAGNFGIPGLSGQ